MPEITLSPAELIVADYVIVDKLIIGVGQQVEYLAGTITLGIYDRHPEYANEIIEVVNRRSKNIRHFLLQEGYIECIIPLIPHDKLTDKGIQARKLGGHKKYIEWKESEDKKKRVEEFPKKKWYLYEPIKWAVFILLGWFANDLFNTLGRKATTQSKIQQDSTKPSPHLPKTLNKTDTGKISR